MTVHAGVGRQRRGKGPRGKRELRRLRFETENARRMALVARKEARPWLRSHRSPAS